MKIIFLDYDGVVNNLVFQDVNGEPNFNFPGVEQVSDMQAVAWLNKVIREHPDTKIVVSSTWRGRDDYKECLTRAGFRGEIIGRTTTNHYGARGLEIQDWLDSHQELDIEDFIILDDDSDMCHLMDHLIKTDTILGMNYYTYEKICDRWRKPVIHIRLRLNLLNRLPQKASKYDLF